MSEIVPPAIGPQASTILLVDDEVDILPEYQELLELEGLHALTTSSPDHALDMVKQHSDIAVVVTDLKMAGLNGAELIKAMRRSVSSSRALSFIVLTGDASACQDLDASDIPILLKPVNLLALIAAIRAALPGKRP